MAFVIGLILVSPPGLLRDPLFRSSVRNLGAVLVLVLLAALIQRLAGESGQKDASYPWARGRESELEEREVENAAMPTNSNTEFTTASICNGRGTKSTGSTIVTLVHGTSQPRWFSWFRRKRSKTNEHNWVKAESEFAKKLTKNAPPGVQVRSFFWSGENSHNARIKAAEKLQTHVRQLRTDFPDAEQICVGHSHGGSIIYYALNDSAVENALLGYAFLSTPFLDFQPRRYDLLDAKEYVLIALALFIVIPSYPIAIWMGWSLFGFGPTFLATFLLIPFAVYSRRYRRRAWHGRQEAEKFLTAIPKPYCAPDKAIFLRIPGDEVSNGLGLVYLFAWLQIRSQVGAERYVRKREERPVQFQPLRATAFGRQLVSLIILYATATWSFVSALLCSKAFLLGFGPDVSKHAPFLQITAEATPPGEWTLRQLLPHSATGASLAHSSYDHADVPRC